MAYLCHLWSLAQHQSMGFVWHPEVSVNLRDSVICAGGRPAFGPDLRPPLPRRGRSSSSFQGRWPPANPYPGWTGESQKKKKKKKNKGLNPARGKSRERPKGLPAKQVQVRFYQQATQTNQRIEMPPKAKAVAKGKGTKALAGLGRRRLRHLL